MKKTVQYLSRSGVALATVLGLSACSWLPDNDLVRDRSDDYLKAEQVPAMQVPEGMDKTASLEPLYPIPKATNTEVDLSEGFDVPRPQPISANSLEQQVKIQKLAGRRWVLITAPPSEIWTRVRAFLNANNLQVIYADTTQGIMETAWLQFVDDDDNKHKYRIQMDQGVQPDTTEIHVRHMQAGIDVPAGGQINWPERSIDPEREAIVVDDLAATLASELEGAGTSLLAQSIGGESKVKLNNQGVEPGLEMVLEYERAWATLAHSLTQEGFSIYEEDMQVGLFYVAYQPVTDDEGWFGWFSSDEDKLKPAPQTSYSIATILNGLNLPDTPENRALFASIKGQSNNALNDVPGYLVAVRGNDKDIRVVIRQGDGTLMPTKDAKKMLRVIRRNLI